MGLAIGLLLGAILLFWLGTRQRKKVYAEYEDDSQKYTATTTMTLIKQTKSETSDGKTRVTAIRNWSRIFVICRPMSTQ